MEFISELRKDSEVLKIKLVEAMRVHKEKPLITLVEENPIGMDE